MKTLIVLLLCCSVVGAGEAKLDLQKEAALVQGGCLTEEELGIIIAAGEKWTELKTKGYGTDKLQGPRSTLFQAPLVYSRAERWTDESYKIALSQVERIKAAVAPELQGYFLGDGWQYAQLHFIGRAKDDTNFIARWQLIVPLVKRAAGKPSDRSIQDSKDWIRKLKPCLLDYMDTQPSRFIDTPSKMTFLIKLISANVEEMRTVLAVKADLLGEVAPPDPKPAARHR